MAARSAAPGPGFRPHTTPQSPRLPAPPRPAAEDWLGLLAVASVWLFQLDVEGGDGAVSRDRETCTHVPGVVSGVLGPQPVLMLMGALYLLAR